jgi:hypothetical protein
MRALPVLRLIRPRPLTAAVLLARACSGCASIGPRPWEKDILARPEMQLDPYPLQTAAAEHIYFSKEASSGGRGFAGGGCGCN